MAVPFRIGVMQLTMEPLDEMLASARAMDEAGMDTVWLAEAYPWWRKHQMEARGSTVVSALMARETKRLTIAWGIISPYTRHPVQVAMDARVVQEAAGPGRFIVGFGTSKIFLNNAKLGGPPKVTKPLGHMRDSVEIVRGILGGERFEYDGKVFSADIPALSDEAHAPAWDVPVYVAGTAPMMQQLGGEIGDGLLTPSITTPDYVRYTARQHRRRRGEVGARSRRRRPRLHDPRLDPRDRSRPGPRRRARDRRHVPRQQGAEHPGLGRRAARARRDRAGRDPPGRRGDGAGRAAGGEGAGDRRAARQVQADRRHARRLHRGDRGVPRRRLHPHHARALGRRPATSRSASSARRCCRTSGTCEDHGTVTTEVTIDRDRLVETASRMIDVHSFTGRRAGDGRADGRALREPPACTCSGSRSRTAAPTRSGSCRAPAAARA